MILQSEYWFDIVPRVDGDEEYLAGKWLFFGKTEVLHAWLEPLNALVESGQLRAVKVARKLAEWDPFPNKPCVMCVFTRDSEQDRAAARQTLKLSLGIDVEVWKSNLDTRRDWAPGGWLSLEAELNALKRQAADVGNDLDDAQKAKLLALTEQLNRALHELRQAGRVSELDLNQTVNVSLHVREALQAPDVSLATILVRLEELRAQLAPLHALLPNAASAAALPTVMAPYIVFVLMPFAEQHIDTYDAIRRAATSASIATERVDEKFGSISITDAIRTSIRSARLVVCDLTDERPNVYYELGYAHGLGKDVICIAKQGTVIHFDVYGLKIVFFDTLRTLEERLTREIRGVLNGQR